MTLFRIDEEDILGAIGLGLTAWGAYELGKVTGEAASLPTLDCEKFISEDDYQFRMPSDTEEIVEIYVDGQLVSDEFYRLQEKGLGKYLQTKLPVDKGSIVEVYFKK